MAANEGEVKVVAMVDGEEVMVEAVAMVELLRFRGAGSDGHSKDRFSVWPCLT